MIEVILAVATLSLSVVGLVIIAIFFYRTVCIGQIQDPAIFNITEAERTAAGIPQKKYRDTLSVFIKTYQKEYNGHTYIPVQGEYMGNNIFLLAMRRIDSVSFDLKDTITVRFVFNNEKWEESNVIPFEGEPV